MSDTTRELSQKKRMEFGTKAAVAIRAEALAITTSLADCKVPAELEAGIAVSNDLLRIASNLEAGELGNR
jgi:hypothetical protein